MSQNEFSFILRHSLWGNCNFSYRLPYQLLINKVYRPKHGILYCIGNDEVYPAGVHRRIAGGRRCGIYGGVQVIPGVSGIGFGTDQIVRGIA